MKLAHALLLTVPLVAAAVTASNEAAACGGCAAPVGEDTQVTGHRMLLSVSKTSTTLWDQIEYSGAPSSFAWVLPIKGQVEIGLSSDVLFAQLSDLTRTTIAPPPLNCPPPPSCWGWSEDDLAGGTGGSGGAPNGGVTVISQQVVGPYDTVQLSSQDPAALKNWLIMNGYNIPLDVAPVIDTYVNEKFDFLALKLIPGADVNSMRPVRITSQGAAASLPLRMVAVGTGAITPITLWMIGEGRYEPTNFPWFTIGQPEIVWNWDTSESNYAKLKDDGFTMGNNSNWLVQHARPLSQWSVRSALEQVVSIIPEQSGYGDPADGYATAFDELDADMQKAFGGLNEGSIWLTRMNAELARQALDKDLAIGASAAQTEISSFFQATKAIGTPPACPVYDPCPPSGSNNPGGVDTGGVWWGDFGDGKPNNGGASSAGCAVSGESNGAAALVIMGVGLGLSISRRRRAARSDNR
ncbi:MAG: DUF2330 domain-containing protein [Polyangiaceae bacterium]|nr:DUF2330 domain-containing protein [Polyangiaceae bacterium]